MAFCSNCGKEISGTDKFCPNCGAALESASSSVNNRTSSVAPDFDNAPPFPCTCVRET